MKNSLKKKKKVFAYLHTHWDREWYREYEEFRIRLIEVVDDMLNKLEKKEIPSFYFDGQTSALEDYLEIRPEKENLIKSLIKEKRLFIGPYYCSTDSFLVDSESLIKNLQLGLNYSTKFGCNDFTAYHADTFGHSAHIPRIIKYFGIKNAVFWRGLGDLCSEFEFNKLNSTYLIEGYFHDYFSANVSYEQKAKMLKKTLDRIAKYSSDNLLLPLGADHLAVADNIKEQIKEVNKLLDDYEIVLATPFNYFEKIKNNYKKSVNHEFRDTTRNFILPGVNSSRIDIKQKNAKAQWQISRILQPIQALTSFIGLTKNFQPETNYIHKLLIQNQPHDSIYGCSIDNVHSENIMRFKKIEEASHAVLCSIARDIYDEKNISVFNLSNFELNGALKIKTTQKLDKIYNAQLISKTRGFPLTRLYRINEIPVTEDYTDIYEYLIDLKKIKPFSLKTITAADINTKSNLKITAKSIENEYIKLEVKNNKILVEDKIRRKKYPDFINFIDRADIGDSYNFGALKNDKALEAKILKTKIKETGRIRNILNITFAIDIPVTSTNRKRASKTKKHILNLDAILENQNNFIELKLNWNNKSLNHILQAKLNMENPVTETYSDDLAGFIKRKFNPDYNIYDLLPAPRGIELKHNTAPLQKCLWTQNIGIITEGLQEYEVWKNELRLTLLRATGTISNPHNPTRGTPAGPPLPTPDLQMIGDNSARFAICFSEKIQNIQPSVEKFYDAAMLLQANLTHIDLFNSGNKNIILTTIKTNTENDLIIRFLNASNLKQKLKFTTKLQNKAVYITDAMEQIQTKYADSIIEPNSFITILIKK